MRLNGLGFLYSYTGRNPHLAIIALLGEFLVMIGKVNDGAILKLVSNRGSWLLTSNLSLISSGVVIVNLPHI